MHFSLVKLNPHPEQSAQPFDDVVLPLFFAFKKLNFDVEIRVNSLHPTAKNIIFGANQYSRLPLETIPRDSIIFNLEQVSSGDIWFTPQYVRMLRQFQVWDYSPRNCTELKERFGIEAQCVRLGYVEEMTRIVSTSPPIYDVLFYGALNARRVLALRELQRAGIRLYVPNGILFGAERDEKIALSRIVVNIHFYLPATLEVARIGYLLANKRVVVSERANDTEIPSELDEACIYTPYESLEKTIITLLQDKEKIASQAEKGFEAFSVISQVDALRHVVGERKFPVKEIYFRC